MGTRLFFNQTSFTFEYISVDRFYPNQSEELARSFAAKVLAATPDVSAAQVQGLFMFFKNDPMGAINNAQHIEIL